MFFCDPFGSTSPDSLFNHGANASDHNFIFFHDQEPVHLDTFSPLFDAVDRRNLDLRHGQGPKHAGFVTSERDSDAVDTLCSQRGWQAYYYFFHGWAALDWFRGYDRTFLIPKPSDRIIDHSFINPNRIIGGMRQHRVSLMYHILKNRISNAYVSFPHTCPVEQVPATELARKLLWDHPDAVELFIDAKLPWDMPGEQDHPMHSCWLSLFDESARSLAYVVTETVYSGRRHHLTEKTFKPICLQMPFVMVSTAGSLEYLRSYGFQTFGDVWDESYDQETNDVKRMEKIAELLSRFDQMTPSELQSTYEKCYTVIQHNYEHFYNGGFETTLWLELQNMLTQIQKDFV